MIQPTYISERKCGNKWYPMDDAPVPLLRTNYLSEFRTEIEKAQARKNLGIPDDMQMKWGGMSGHIEEQDDLVYYVRLKAEEYAELFARYTNAISSDITTVSQALDYTMQFIIDQRQNNDDVNASIDSIFELINTTQQALQKNIDINSENIVEVEKEIGEINNAITKLNQDLINIDIAPKLTAWIQTHLSDTIIFENDKLAVIISDAADNALTNNNGLYVKDNSSSITANAQAIESLQQAQSAIQSQVDKQQTDLDSIKDTIDISVSYITDLDDAVEAPVAVGGITAGTTVGELRGKSLFDIVDIMLFPTTVRDLIYPRLSYSPTYQLIEVGQSVSKPILTFIKGDAGQESPAVETLTLNGSVIEDSGYNELGTYMYSASVSYEAGEYIKDSKGQVTNKRVEAGTVTASSTIITTYAWFAGNTNSVYKQSLVQFGYSSGEKVVSMGGNAVVKLPGANSSINSFTVDGGLGYTAVNLSGWTESTEEINGITYKVWTKNDPYSSDCSHKINFTLAL